jgi:hypothetical protein
VHNNPVNNIDPSGMFFTAIGALCTSVWQWTMRKVDWVKVSVISPIILRISQWANRGSYTVYHASKSIYNWSKSTAINLSYGDGRWGQGFYTAARDKIAMLEAQGSDVMLRINIYFNRVLDLTNPRVVKAVERILNRPGAVDKVFNAPSGVVLEEAKIINEWARNSGYEAIKVWSVQAMNEINYLIINGRPVIEEVSPLLE